MRKSNVLFLWLAGGLLFFGLLFVDAHFRSRANVHSTDAMAAMVRKLQLTDLCLFTEARYTRHLSQADLHSAFQDYPTSPEHFPAGSLTRPPRHLTSAVFGVRSEERSAEWRVRSAE